MFRIQTRYVVGLVGFLVLGAFGFLLARKARQSAPTIATKQQLPPGNGSDPGRAASAASDTSALKPKEVYAKELRIDLRKSPPMYSSANGTPLDGYYDILHERRIPSSDTGEEHAFLSESGLFHKGLKEGEWMILPPLTEMLYYSETYKNGLLEGKFAVQNRDQTTRYQTNFRNGSGVWKSFYATGQPKLVGSYQKGLMHGTWREYKPDGTLKEETRYEHGVLLSTRIP